MSVRILCLSLSLFVVSTTLSVAQVLQQQGTSCRLVTFLPFSDLREGPDPPHANPNQYGYGNWPSQEHLANYSTALLAAAEMARRHFNNRDDRVVPELKQLTTDCDIQLADDSVYLDSTYTRDQTVQHLLAQNASQVCAVVGPLAYEAHAGIAALTETMHIPQVAFATLDHKLSRTDWFPNFVRLTPTGTAMGETMPKALYRGDMNWHRKFVANIYEPDYGEQFENPIEDAEDDLGYSTLTESYIPGDQESLYEALHYVTDDGDGFRTVLLTIDQWAMMDDIAQVAVDKAVVGKGYFWAMTGDALPLAQLENLELEPNSPLDVLLAGAAVFTNWDRFLYPDNGGQQGKAFLQAWRQQNADHAAQVEAHRPDGAIGKSLPPEYFQKNDPVHYASFIYDAVMSVGLSACAAHQQEQPDGAKLSHVNMLKRLQFTGASGPVKFTIDDDGDPGPDRDPAGVLYGLHNVRPTTVQDNGKRKYEMVLVATYETKNGEGRWIPNGETFFFPNNETEEPTPYISPNKLNYLPENTQTVGFVLVGVSLAISIGSALWLFIHRDERSVKASQPEFLIIMCIGASLVAASLVFVSYDEGKGWSEQQLSAACVAFPWFFVLGYEVMYCALVCKLWRLSKLLQMRRRVIAVKQVLAPFGVVTLCILGIMTTWTLHDPLQWEREEVLDDPRNTYGRCETQNGMEIYLIPLGALILAAMLATANLCWNLRDVQTDLAESRCIFFGIFAQLQVWAIGVPLLIIAEDVSREVSYIMSAALCFVFSTTLVCSVVWPKIFVWCREKYFGGQSNRKIVINTTGNASTTVSGINVPPTGHSVAAPSLNTNSYERGVRPGSVDQSNFSVNSAIHPVPEEPSSSSAGVIDAQVEPSPVQPHCPEKPEASDNMS